MQLSWIPGLDGGHEQRFEVKYSQNRVDWVTHSENIKITRLVTGLGAGTEYHFQIKAINQKGESTPAVVSGVTKGS